MRKKVEKFAEIMERVLKENDGKGGWKHCGTNYLLRRLGDEVEELRRATGTPCVTCERGLRETPEKIAREAADVANFAMMIADVFGGLG